MKKQILLAFIILVLASLPALAQNPIPDPDTVQTPVQEGDPTMETLPARLDYVDDRRRITPAEVPDAVRQSLESSAQYTDWEKATLYHDRNRDHYLVEYPSEGKVTTYRFSKEGKPVVEEK